MDFKKLAKGVNYAFFKTEKFKKSLISISFIAPLGEKAALDNLVLQLLALPVENKIKIDTEKCGEELVLSLTAQTDDQSEKSVQELAALLFKAVFRPDVSLNGFSDESLEVAKKALLKKIKNETKSENDFALNFLIETMCQNEPFGLCRFGKTKAIENADGKEVFSRWLKLLVNCPIHINYIGSASEEIVLHEVMPYLEQIQRKEVWPIRTDFICDAYEEISKNKKSKFSSDILAVGFRAGMSSDTDNIFALCVLTQMLKSELGENSSVKLDSGKGLLTIVSKTDSFEKEFEKIKSTTIKIAAGDFTQSQQKKAIKAIFGCCDKIENSAELFDVYLKSLSTQSSFISLEELKGALSALSKEEIMVASAMLSLDTVCRIEKRED